MAITVGPKRKIYRGGYQDNAPEQVELPAAAAGLQPGMLAQRAGNTLAVHTTAGKFYVVNTLMHNPDLTYAYKQGETTFAYEPKYDHVFLVQAVAGLTFAADAPLAADGAGRVRVAADGDAVIGYAHEAQATATVAGELIDVRMK